jgi:hypothetical protein
MPRHDPQRQKGRAPSRISVRSARRASGSSTGTRAAGNSARPGERRRRDRAQARRRSTSRRRWVAPSPASPQHQPLAGALRPHGRPPRLHSVTPPLSARAARPHLDPLLLPTTRRVAAAVAAPCPRSRRYGQPHFLLADRVARFDKAAFEQAPSQVRGAAEGHRPSTCAGFRRRDAVAARALLAHVPDCQGAVDAGAALRPSARAKVRTPVVVPLAAATQGRPRDMAAQGAAHRRQRRRLTPNRSPA